MITISIHHLHLTSCSTLVGNATVITAAIEKEATYCGHWSDIQTTSAGRDGGSGLRRGCWLHLGTEGGREVSGRQRLSRFGLLGAAHLPTFMRPLVRRGWGVCGKDPPNLSHRFVLGNHLTIQVPKPAGWRNLLGDPGPLALQQGAWDSFFFILISTFIKQTKAKNFSMP